MKCTWLSMPPAVTIMPSAAMISVPGPMTMSTPGCTSGLPALPIAQMRWPRMPMSALTMPQWSRISALVMTQIHRLGRSGAVDALALPHAVTDGLAAAELDFLAIAAGAQRVVLLDLDDQAVSARRTRSPTVGP
jgi:hypothetical protein